MTCSHIILNCLTSAIRYTANTQAASILANGASKARVFSIAGYSALIFMAPTALASVPTIPEGEHSSADVDITQPIAALDNLTSLKNAPPLSLTLPEFHHFTTRNGVPVIFVQAQQLPIVDIDIRFNAGSARDNTMNGGDDTTDLSDGLAGLTASMLIKGTQNLDETAFAKEVEQLGIELGSAAYKDQLVINLRSLSDDEHLQPALSLVSDVMTQPRFDEAVLERSKAQQILGLKQMLQSPAYIASTVFGKELYGNHPYAHSSYGTVDTIPNINVSDLKAFKSRYLVAQNATMSITGDLSLAAAKAVAERVTAALPNGTPAPKLPQPIAPQSAKHIHINYDSDQTSVIIGQLGYALDSNPHTTQASAQRQTQFSIGNEILAGGGFNSRLMGKVRKELGYTYGIYGNMTAMQTNGPYVIRFSTRNEKAPEAIAATLETINTTLRDGVTQDEFNLTTDNLINSYPMGFASNAGINSMLGTLNFNQLPDSYITDYINRVNRSDIDAVNQTLSQTLMPEKFIIVTVGDAASDFAQLSTAPLSHVSLASSKPLALAEHIETIEPIVTQHYDSIESYLEQNGR